MTIQKEMEADGKFSAAELREAWRILSPADQLEYFRLLDVDETGTFFDSLDSKDQLELLLGLPESLRKLLIRSLPPDDITDIIQMAPESERAGLLDLLEESTRKEIAGLLAYAEDDAGGLMNPRFARLRPDMNADMGISYLKKQSREKLESINYAYVLDHTQNLLGVLSFRDLLAADKDALVKDIMIHNVITVHEKEDQENVGRIIADYDLSAVPVVDDSGKMKGIITVDDIVDVVNEEATEDIHKFGGMEALEAPYLETPFRSMLGKRASWLTLLFFSEMLTATAMGYFEGEIAKAVVLALFIPLIISSGGNSGSQASTLVIRALALGEVTAKDWLKIVLREIWMGLALGIILGTIGFIRISVWPSRVSLYGEHYIVVAQAVAFSLIGVVTWGTISGSMLPLLLKRLGFDPASASAPFVATLSDVTGLVIYFTIAKLFLTGIYL